MSGGGTLTIGAKNAHVENGANENRQAGDFIALSIADTGTGMTPEILQHAFEPFFTTKGHRPWTQYGSRFRGAVWWGNNGTERNRQGHCNHYISAARDATTQTGA